MTRTYFSIVLWAVCLAAPSVLLAQNIFQPQGTTTVSASADTAKGKLPECTDPRTSKVKDCVRVAVFADGNVKGLIEGEGKGGMAAGALGVALEKRSFDFLTLINVLATKDTLTKGFGPSLLPRAAGGGFNSGLIEFRFRDVFSRLGLLDKEQPSAGSTSARREGLPGFFSDLDFYLYASASSQVWSPPAAALSEARRKNPSLARLLVGDSTAFNVATLGFGAGIYKEMINGKVDNTSLAVYLGGGIVYRGLFGDLRNSDFDELRADVLVLGGPETDYWGTEIGLEVRVNNLAARIEYYNIWSTRDIRGISNGQVVVSFSVAGDIFNTAQILVDRDP